MDRYEFRLQTAFTLALLWRGDLTTAVFNPEFTCSQPHPCPNSLAESQDYWITDASAVFPKQSAVIENLIMSFANHNYGEVAAGMAELRLKQHKSDFKCTTRTNHGKVSTIVPLRDHR